MSPRLRTAARTIGVDEGDVAFAVPEFDVAMQCDDVLPVTAPASRAKVAVRDVGPKDELEDLLAG